MNDQDVRDMLRRRAGDVTPAPDAWERITERISGDETAPVVELAPRRLRFPGPPALLGAAAAVVLLLVATVAMLRGGDEDETIRAADGPSTTTAPPTPVTTTPVVGAPTFEGTAVQTARDWIQAIGAGDLDRAYQLLADDSQKAVGGRQGFEAMRSQLAEGWGAWAAAGGLSDRAGPRHGLGADDDGDRPAELPRLAVVVVTGTVAQEGETAFRAIPLNVRGTVVAARVDLFADVEVSIEPGPDESGRALIPGTATVGAYTPAAAKVWFLFDDGAPVDPHGVEGADGDQQFVTVTPKPALSEGRHVLTVAALMVDGRLLSRSVVYTVDDDAPPPTMNCGMVAFTPDSEDAASDITVTTGTTCDEARAFVEVAGRQTSAIGPDQVDVEGYRCVRTESQDDPLPTSTYRCTKGGTVITFVRS